MKKLLAAVLILSSLALSGCYTVHKTDSFQPVSPFELQPNP